MLGRACAPRHASGLHGYRHYGKQEVEPALLERAAVFTDEVALFDCTGVGLQDLAVTAAAVDLAIAKGVATKIEI